MLPVIGEELMSFEPLKSPQNDPPGCSDYSTLDSSIVAASYLEAKLQPRAQNGKFTNFGFPAKKDLSC